MVPERMEFMFYEGNALGWWSKIQYHNDPEPDGQLKTFEICTLFCSPTAIFMEKSFSLQKHSISRKKQTEAFKNSKSHFLRWKINTTSGKSCGPWRKNLLITLRMLLSDMRCRRRHIEMRRLVRVPLMHRTMMAMSCDFHSCDRDNDGDGLHLGHLSEADRLRILNFSAVGGTNESKV